MGVSALNRQKITPRAFSKKILNFVFLAVFVVFEAILCPNRHFCNKSGRLKLTEELVVTIASKRPNIHFSTLFEGVR